MFPYRERQQIPFVSRCWAVERVHQGSDIEQVSAKTRSVWSLGKRALTSAMNAATSAVSDAAFSCKTA